MNVAVTFFAASIVTTQVSDAFVQAPVQPANVDPLAGVAVSVTDVPLLNEVVHAAPQSIPAGALVTVPLPVPTLVTVSPKVIVAVPVTAVMSVPVLLVQLGSVVWLVAWTVFTTLDAAPAPTDTLSVMVDVVPGARLPGRLHETCCPLFEHVQLSPTALAYPNPTGSASLTWIGPVADADPLFVTARVYVAVWPRMKLPMCVDVD
jgi:hypothetical protein